MLPTVVLLLLCCIVAQSYRSSPRRWTRFGRVFVALEGEIPPCTESKTGKASSAVQMSDYWERNELEKKQTEKLSESMRGFRDEARQGIAHVLEGSLSLAIGAFDRAAAFNTSQLLPQRGILAYCVGDYEKAVEQLSRDIYIMEKPKVTKATELRLWLSVALMQLGKDELALSTIDVNDTLSLPVRGQSLFLNQTCEFFSNMIPMEDLLDFIDQRSMRDTQDVAGIRFYGNMYLGLYYDARGEPELAQAFLSLPAQSSRFGPNDMWHHVPRLLYRHRFGHQTTEDDPILTDLLTYDYTTFHGAPDKQGANTRRSRQRRINSAGMII